MERISNKVQNKGVRLFIVLGGFFVANALLAEIIGIKIFSLERTFGFDPVNWMVFGYKMPFNLTAGVLLWPVVFIMTDVINEYFGKQGVRLLSFFTAGLIAYAFVMIFLARLVAPADFWSLTGERHGITDMDIAFEKMFSQSNWIIVGSLVAFLVGQLVDVFIFQRIKKFTGEKLVWLRATGSTIASQLIDSFIVLYIAFYIGQDWALSLVLGIMMMNYIYKVTMAIILTPVIYLFHYLIDAYLGEETARAMREAALEKGFPNGPSQGSRWKGRSY